MLCEKYGIIMNYIYGSYYDMVQSFVDGKCLLTPAKYGDL
jgi:hypothetical protein